MIQPTLVNLNSLHLHQEFHCYPIFVKLGRCVGSCNTISDLCNKVCVPDKTSSSTWWQE